ncbi:MULTISPECIES: ABC transporter ATP-binding protein [unclassified Corynebacterium]|uniref:ABC transporter ATP-binding protein n=1 Tax=unclassified Corynebacterium TaxID=2624378 RepID=UPI001EF5FD12|nr:MULTISPECIES: ABC transporter ATP-binding protein [unclassified Corynebacterium]MCG7258215.1 ABC transporter ATP-binding protein [Corynebacterium sp. ACRQK]MCG7262648.1 ABC transporter ATP-binding protein [Corynebacterium sp. ACRQL]
MINISDLKVKFGDSSALSGVDLTFDRGSIHALLGPNGAGKTTIFKAILGAVDYEGVIHTDPQPLRIGHLIEYPAFYARLTVLENMQLHADYLDAPHDQLLPLLSLVGLDKHMELPCSQTSLGMRQRLGIARSLIGDPQLLLLDEPTNGLDPKGIRECRELLRRVCDERDVSIAISSHNLTEVAALADRLTFLKAGRIIHSVCRSEGTQQDLEDLYIHLMDKDN